MGLYDDSLEDERLGPMRNQRLRMERKDAMVMLTKAHALAVQAKQLEHYAAMYGDEIRARVAAITHPELLDDEPHPVWEVHRHIPCGAKIEALLTEKFR